MQHALVLQREGVFLIRARTEYFLARIRYVVATSGGADVTMAEEQPIGAVKWVFAGGGIGEAVDISGCGGGGGREEGVEICLVGEVGSEEGGVRVVMP